MLRASSRSPSSRTASGEQPIDEYKFSQMKKQQFFEAIQQYNHALSMPVKGLQYPTSMQFCSVFFRIKMNHEGSWVSSG